MTGKRPYNRVNAKPARQMWLPLKFKGEAFTTRQGDDFSAKDRQLMEAVVTRRNLQTALQRVKRNGGNPGIDGMTVKELPQYLKGHWPKIRRQLLEGDYTPSPVKRVEIPKPGGGIRQLGIPTVLDRFIQQSVMQVLQCEWDHTFSEFSYGFRPGRSAHQAIKQCQSYLKQGYRWVVDMDLEKFFDRVNHDKLMSKVNTRVADSRLRRLIRRFLRSGVEHEGKLTSTTEGTPQGGPLTP